MSNDTLLPRYSTHADFEDLPTLLFFDAYVVRVLTSDTSGLLGFITKGLDCDFASTAPKFGYTSAYKLFRGEITYGIFQFGGDNVGFGIHVSIMGRVASEFKKLLDKSAYRFLVLRADCALDVPGECFDQIAYVSNDLIVRRRLSSSVAGDWVNQHSRTLYIGSRSSIAFGRIYEKSDQLELPDELAFVRLEIEFKPHKNDRQMVASWQPYDFISSSPWVVELFNILFFNQIIAKDPLGRHYTKTDHSRAWAHLLKQYRKTIMRELANRGGDVESLVSGLLFEDFHGIVDSDSGHMIQMDHPPRPVTTIADILEIFKND